MSLFAQTVSNPYKQIVRRYFEEVWTNADFSSLDELLCPQVSYHIRNQTPTWESEDLVRAVNQWKAAFPDLQFEVEGIVVERVQAAVRVAVRGTHTGVWEGIPVSGRSVEVREMVFFRFEGERIAEVWELVDADALRRQLMGDE